MPKERKPPGTASPQRTDRNDAAVQAVRVPTGGPYGQAQRLRQAQQAVPLPDDNARFQQALNAARQANLTRTPLTAPTSRPDEPVTTGLPVGPGAGPEAIPPVGRTGPDPGAVAMAPWLPMLELHAVRPGASATLRQFVRTLKASLPPGFDWGDTRPPGVD